MQLQMYMYMHVYEYLYMLMYVYMCYMYMALSVLFLVQIGGVGIDRGTVIIACIMKKYPGAPFHKKY